MKKYYSLLLLLSLGLPIQAQRQSSLLNRYWLYQQGDVADGASNSADEAGWSHISLPHSFSMPYFMSRDFYTGYGWYRKHVNLTAEQLADGRQHTIEFDGVFQVAEVYVNGRLMGQHTGGYTGFEVNVTDALKVGSNLVAIRVNNIWQPDVAPRAGEHTFSGGIYRNVRWVEKAAQHIAWCGVGITTPGLEPSNGKRSKVKVEVTVANMSATAKPLTLQSIVRDAAGRKVALVNKKVNVAAQGTDVIALSTSQIKNPHLWSPETPYLYTVETRLLDGKKVVDSTTEQMGFRWTKWTADHGFFLNGTRRYFQGANVHQDQAGWGDAVTDSAMLRDVRMMRDAGFDFIRGSHYPHAPGFVEACDKEGVMFWSEAPFWGIGGFKKDGYWNSSAYPIYAKHNDAFEESALQQLEEMIRIHRNHPSVIAWSMSNEPFFSAKEVIPGVRHLLKRMVERSHQLDSTRPAAIGGAQRPLDDSRIDLLGDVAGYNGDGATLPAFQRPGVPSVVSEYGSVTADRPGRYTAGWGSMGKNDAWKGVEWRAGHAIWCGFDHGSIAGSTLGKMGIVDYFRIPKRSYYWYRENLAHQTPPVWPVDGTPTRLRLTASKAKGIKTDGTDDAWLYVEVLDDEGRVLTACPDVTLQIVCGPGEFPTGRSITFSQKSDIRILDGQAAISVRAYEAGMAVLEATANGLASSRIELQFVGDVPFIEGRTPLVTDRPYQRYERRKVEEQTFGLNNPTFASSQTGSHPAGAAADGNNATWWQPADNDAAPALWLDTEKGLDMSQITVDFPQKAVWKATVEGSIDGKTWTVIADFTDNTTPLTRWTYNKNGNNLKTFRFVRVSFPSASSAAIAEIRVKGYVK
jgi:beta-galactosidase